MQTSSPGYRWLEGDELYAYHLGIVQEQAVYENGLTPEQRAEKWRQEDFYRGWQPRPTPRCVRCGETVLEIRYSASHVEWQCLEETCRHSWGWRER